MPRTRTNPERRDHPLSDHTELRVHGVGGTRPEFLLEDDQPELVAGDRIAGFYRIHPRAPVRSPAPEGSGLEIEAYSWGGFSSRSGARVLWLLLLPFAFANLAGWMVVKNYTGRRREIVAVLVRWAALAVTGLFVIWFGALTVDVIAFQCGGQEACASNHWWLSFFGYEFFDGNAGRRIAVGLLPPIALLVALYVLGATSLRRYEGSLATDESDPADTSRDPAYTTKMSQPEFWGSQTFVRKLKRFHIAGGLAGLTFIASFALLHLDEGDVGHPSDPRFWIMLAAIAAIALVLGFIAVAGRVSLRMSWIPLAVAAAVAAWFLADALWRKGPESFISGEQLVGWRHAALLLALVTVGILLLLGLATLAVQRPVPGASRPVFWGLGPLLVTMIGMLIAAGVTAGGIIRIAEWLDQGEEADVVIEVSSAYDWLAVGFFWFLVFLALLAVGYYWWQRWKPFPFGPRRWQTEVAAVLASEPEYAAAIEGRPSEGASWLRGMVKARALRRLAGYGDGILGPAVIASFVAGLVLLIVWAIRDPFDEPRPVYSWIAWSAPLATWVMALLPVGLIGAMYRSFRNEGLRRRIGILWETITFWPRWFHPLAPPNYSARAVPELQNRLAILTAAPRAVVVSAHSQGTVLAAVTLLGCPADVRARVGLVTYGAPLARLYGKYFPTQFGVDTMAEVAAALATAGPPVAYRWRNLYRLTDPIGGAVGATEPAGAAPWTDIDVEFPDPRPTRPPPFEPFTNVKAHSGYFVDVDWTDYYQAVDDVRS